MNTQIIFDKFAYVDRLRHAGVDEAIARAHGEGLEQALREEVATKSDINEVKADLKSVEVALKSDLKDAVSDLRSEIKDLRSEMQVGFAQVDTKFAQMDTKFAQVDAKIEKVVHDQVYRIVPLIVGLLAIIGVALHFWK